VVGQVTVYEPDWTDSDRGLLLALLAERGETCPSCGHPMSLCRDPATAGRWQVDPQVCQPTRVAQAVAENDMQAGKRGVHYRTRLAG
jgi:hypothetical protein